MRGNNVPAGRAVSRSDGSRTGGAVTNATEAEQAAGSAAGAVGGALMVEWPGGDRGWEHPAGLELDR